MASKHGTGSDSTSTTSYPESTALIGAAQSIWNGSMASITIQIVVSDRLNEFMGVYGVEPIDMAIITDSDMRHIKISHTDGETMRGQIPIDPADFGVIPAILSEFDGFEESDSDALGNKKFLLDKAIGDRYYVVTIQRGKKKLGIKTMWKKPGASC